MFTCIWLWSSFEDNHYRCESVLLPCFYLETKYIKHEISPLIVNNLVPFSTFIMLDNCHLYLAVTYFHYPKVKLIAHDAALLCSFSQWSRSSLAITNFHWPQQIYLSCISYKLNDTWHFLQWMFLRFIIWQLSVFHSFSQLSNIPLCA